jgi:hypothetical protein
MSAAVSQMNSSLKSADFQISVAVFSIVMAWTLGFLVPTVALLYS